MSAAITQSLFLLLLPIVGGPGSPSKPPAETKPATPETIVEVPPRFDAKRCPLPRYPDACRRKKEEGTVVLDVQVRVDGTVSSVKLFKSSSFAALDEAAKSAVSGWKFLPATRNGVAIAGSARLPFQFFLEIPKPAKS